MDPRAARRDFLISSFAYGIALTFGPRAVARVFKQTNLGREFYDGPVIGILNRLTMACDSGQLTPEAYVLELGARLLEVKPHVEFETWIDEAKAKGTQGATALYRSSRAARMPTLDLFYIPAHRSHAPHGHHSMVSVQTVIDGTLHVRQFDRVKLFEPMVLGIRKTSDRRLSPGEQFRMTDLVDNVHWFGADESPVVLLNCNCDVQVGDTFYRPRESRRKYRRHLDPTTGEIRDGLIVAREMLSKEEQEAHREKFERLPVSAFDV